MIDLKQKTFINAFLLFGLFCIFQSGCSKDKSSTDPSKDFLAPSKGKPEHGGQSPEISGNPTSTTTTQTRENRPEYVPMEFVPIRAGRFTMGSPASEEGRKDDEGQVAVNLTRDFEMQATEVTQYQWFSVMKNNPSLFRRSRDCENEHQVIDGTRLCPNHPVESVMWNDVQSFIAKLNQKNDGYVYRLPTEAEWEYAARAGSTTPYFFDVSSSALIWIHAWLVVNSKGQTSAVKQKKKNPWGLYDIYGNVLELVQDYYHEKLLGENDPIQTKVSRYRVARGGCWMRDKNIEMPSLDDLMSSDPVIRKETELKMRSADVSAYLSLRSANRYKYDEFEYDDAHRSTSIIGTEKYTIRQGDQDRATRGLRLVRTPVSKAGIKAGQ